MSIQRSTVVGVGAVLAHVALAVFPFAATGLVAPLWAFVAVYVWWLALLVVAVRLALGRRLVAALVPAVALVGWFAFLSLGGAVLGWTA